MRRMFRLSDASHKDIDLREYEDEILEIADRIIPGKNPKVYQNYFMTDELTQGERVRLGRELSKSPRLKQYGKEVTSFRLFEGKSVEEKEEEKDGRERWKKHRNASILVLQIFRRNTCPSAEKNYGCL